MCKEGESKGQYDPLMVVHRKRYGQKGATLGKKLEGTSAYTYPLPPSPEHSGKTSSNMFGPPLSKARHVKTHLITQITRLSKER